jgi:DNA-binding protein
MSNEIRDTIFIGKKPLMTYVTTAIIQLAILPKIIIKARGMSIGTAVDVVQIVLRKTGPAFVVEDIKINSESLVSTDGRNRDVSTIEITLKRATDKVV